jgi:hypothetical protein
MADKNSQCKLDFKFRLQDDMTQWTMTDFRNTRYYWTDDTSNYVSNTLVDIKDKFYSAKFPVDEGYNNYGYYTRDASKIKQMKDFLYSTPEWQKCEAAFQKWLKRRSGVIEAWNTFVTDHNSNSKQTPISTDPLTLQLFTAHCHRNKFRNILENTRPIKIEAGSVVKLKDEYKTNNYDPYYWDYENRSLERIGTVLQYTGDCATNKCGEGSREVRVLWFGSGKETKIAEKVLEFYVQPVVSEEVKTEEVNQ